MRKNRSDAKEYLKRIENQSHTDMKVPTLTGTSFEELDLDFTSTLRIQNHVIVIPLDCLLRPDAVLNYNANCN